MICSPISTVMVALFLCYWLCYYFIDGSKEVHFVLMNMVLMMMILHCKLTVESWVQDTKMVPVRNHQGSEYNSPTPQEFSGIEFSSCRRKKSSSESISLSNLEILCCELAISVVNCFLAHRPTNYEVHCKIISTAEMFLEIWAAGSPRKAPKIISEKHTTVGVLGGETYIKCNRSVRSFF